MHEPWLPRRENVLTYFIYVLIWSELKESNDSSQNPKSIIWRLTIQISLNLSVKLGKRATRTCKLCKNQILERRWQELVEFSIFLHKIEHVQHDFKSKSSGDEQITGFLRAIGIFAPT